MTLKARITRTESLWFLPWKVEIIDDSNGWMHSYGHTFTWTKAGAVRWGKRELAREIADRKRAQIPPLDIYPEEGQ